MAKHKYENGQAIGIYSLFIRTFTLCKDNKISQKNRAELQIEERLKHLGAEAYTNISFYNKTFGDLSYNR